MGDFAVNTSVAGVRSQPCADALIGSEPFTSVRADGALEIGPQVRAGTGAAVDRLDLSAAAVFGNGSPQRVRGCVLTADDGGPS
ncbi:hypothetical protein [Kitasatospora sp. NPDC093679]|uniref:hypothetical protein n=1 Tax=Kitasatospora sp. NPDC093679 TaxID=3154983 RepID=UPI00343B1BE6